MSTWTIYHSQNKVDRLIATGNEGQMRMLFVQLQIVGESGFLLRDSAWDVRDTIKDKRIAPRQGRKGRAR